MIGSMQKLVGKMKNGNGSISLLPGEKAFGAVHTIQILFMLTKFFIEPKKGRLSSSEAFFSLFILFC